MAKFEFTMSLSAQQIHSVYQGRARYILVESDEGLKLQLPAANFRNFITADGIHGRFQITIDASNKIRVLHKL